MWAENPSTCQPAWPSSRLINPQRTRWSRCPRMRPWKAPCPQKRSLSSLSPWKMLYWKELRPTRRQPSHWHPATCILPFLPTVKAPRPHRPHHFRIGRHPGRRRAGSSWSRPHSPALLFPHNPLEVTWGITLTETLLFRTVFLFYLAQSHRYSPTLDLFIRCREEAKIRGKFVPPWLYLLIRPARRDSFSSDNPSTQIQIRVGGDGVWRWENKAALRFNKDLIKIYRLGMF